MDNFRVLRRAVLCWIVGTVLFILPQILFAATSCTFTSATSVTFGAYDVFSAFPNNNGIGDITIQCQGGGGANFSVALSTGQSNNYLSRVMKSGSNPLNYNLYTNASRTTVWGDGSSGSSTMAVARKSSTTLSVFGQIPTGQDAMVGIYSDAITVIINF